jgi:hypothetical protein
MKYKCNVCEKEFDRKSTYDNHLKRKKTCKPKINNNLDLNDKINIEDNTTVNRMLNDVNKPLTNVLKNVKENEIQYECLICHKKYKSRIGLHYHKSKHEKYEEASNKITSDNIKILEEMKNLIHIQQQEINELKECVVAKTKTINNNQNNMTNSHNNLNTNVNIFTDYGDEKLEMLTLEDRQDICSQPCDSIYKIVKKMHINKDHPSYMNLCVENLRSNIMYAIEKNNFIAKDKSITLFDVIHTAGYRLREIIKNDESTKNIDEIQKGSLKTLHDFILRYDPTNEDLDGNKIKPSQDTIDKYNKIKLEIELLLYNNRSMIMDNYHKLQNEHISNV